MHVCPARMAYLYITYVYVTSASVRVRSLREWANACMRLHPHVSVETCVLKRGVGFGMRLAWGGCVSRELKVLDKTKWIWQARLIRQQFGDPIQTRRKRKNHRLTFSSLSKAPIDYVSVSPNKTVNVRQPKATWRNYYSSFLADWKQPWDKGKETYPSEMTTCVNWLRVRDLSFKECELISWAVIANIPPSGLLISDTMGSFALLLIDEDNGENHPI